MARPPPAGAPATSPEIAGTPESPARAASAPARARPARTPYPAPAATPRPPGSRPRTPPAPPRTASAETASPPPSTAPPATAPAPARASPPAETPPAPPPGPPPRAAPCPAPGLPPAPTAGAPRPHSPAPPPRTARAPPATAAALPAPPRSPPAPGTGALRPPRQRRHRLERLQRPRVVLQLERGLPEQEGGVGSQLVVLRRRRGQREGVVPALGRVGRLRELEGGPLREKVVRELLPEPCPRRLLVLRPAEPGRHLAGRVQAVGRGPRRRRQGAVLRLELAPVARPQH